MVNKEHDLISGEMIFLSSTTTPMAKLDDLSKRHNLDCDWLKTTPAQALKHVLTKKFMGNGKTMIRKAAGTATFCVVNETNLTNRVNSYDQNQTYRAKSDGRVIMSTCVDNVFGEWRTCDDMTKSVQEVMECSLGLRVSTYLYKCMAANFGALRISRGAYFVPSMHLEAWGKFANDWVNETDNKISRIQSGCDANTAVAVCTGAKEDLKKRYDEVQAMIAEVDSRPDLPETANQRAKRKVELHARLVAIETAAKEMSKVFGLAIDIADEIIDEAKLEQVLALI